MFRPLLSLRPLPLRTLLARPIAHPSISKPPSSFPHTRGVPISPLAHPRSSRPGQRRLKSDAPPPGETPAQFQERWKTYFDEAGGSEEVTVSRIVHESGGKGGKRGELTTPEDGADTPSSPPPLLPPVRFFERDGTS